ncbi:hypothetical protein M0813_05678 [Anaeramoeba flamelloides]|uniref:Uncharacterized protein n=1 Tax=Anaeramoeba flamelloides TaxID=1746091 RepID=A0AAV8AEN9_9EUKA|nr:hypothetical protein M0812_05076 [Anaeramoeba flamelloides]KAJ6231605.1 hypothetical protein M0813_05678 [Anaeramoeba flamelloides]
MTEKTSNKKDIVKFEKAFDALDYLEKDFLDFEDLKILGEQFGFTFKKEDKKYLFDALGIKNKKINKTKFIEILTEKQNLKGLNKQEDL